MNHAWTFYDAQTGAIARGRITCSPANLAANTPPGHLPIAGTYDPLCQRVNIATGQVEYYQPPAPADDELRTWAWDEETRRWVAQPTLEADKRRALADVHGHIAAVEAEQGRSVREVLLALSTGQAVPAQSATALADIEAAIAPARAAADEIAAATTPEELAAAVAIAVQVINPPVDIPPGEVEPG
jgi:hypothetical protein